MLLLFEGVHALLPAFIRRNTLLYTRKYFSINIGGSEDEVYIGGFTKWLYSRLFAKHAPGIIIALVVYK